MAMQTPKFQIFAPQIPPGRPPSLASLPAVTARIVSPEGKGLRENLNSVKIFCALHVQLTALFSGRKVKRQFTRGLRNAILYRINSY